MRYTHAPTGEVISRSILFPPGKHDDLWIEAAVRFEPTWKIGAYKLMHILTNISVGRRFGLNMETSSVGAGQVWIDGVYYGSRGPVAMLPGAEGAFPRQLGSIMNEGPGQTQNYWWGKVSIWISNPGW